VNFALAYDMKTFLTDLQEMTAAVAFSQLQKKHICVAGGDTSRKRSFLCFSITTLSQKRGKEREREREREVEGMSEAGFLATFDTKEEDKMVRTVSRLINRQMTATNKRLTFVQVKKGLLFSL